MDVMQEAGLINRESRALWESNVYLPFYRVLEDSVTREEFVSGPVQANQHITSQIRRLKGRAEMIGDPLENVLKNWMYGLDAAARNRARDKAFDVGTSLGLIKEVPKKDLVNIIGSQTVKTYAIIKAGASKARAIFDTMDEARAAIDTVITSYSIHYTKLYETSRLRTFTYQEMCAKSS